MYLPAELIKSELQSQGFSVEEFVIDDDMVELLVTSPTIKSLGMKITFESCSVEITVNDSCVDSALLKVNVNDPESIPRIYRAVATQSRCEG